MGRVGLSREKVAKQEGPHLNTNRCPERRAAGQKETARRPKKELKRTRKKKEGLPPLKLAEQRRLRPPVTCQFDTKYRYSEASPVLSEHSLAMPPRRLFQVLWVSKRTFLRVLYTFHMIRHLYCAVVTWTHHPLAQLPSSSSLGAPGQGMLSSMYTLPPLTWSPRIAGTLLNIVRLTGGEGANGSLCVMTRKTPH